MPPTTEIGWREWSQHVLKELERLANASEHLNDRMSKMETQIAMLQIKSGVWGACAGMIPVLVLIMMKYL